MKYNFFSKGFKEIDETCPNCGHKLIITIKGNLVTCFNFDLGIMSYDYFITKYNKEN
jgi:hypothetical protein